MKNNIIVVIISFIISLIVGFLMANVLKIGLPMAIGLGAVIFLIPFIWNNPEWGLGLVAFFLAFERVPTLELGALTLKINHILIIMVFVIFLIKSLAGKKLVLPKDPIRYLILLLIATLTFSFTVSVNLERSFQVLIFMILMLIVYLAVTLIVDSKKILITILSALLVGAAFQVVLGFFQFAGDAVGLPNSITLLKEGYDKSTFGFARVQGTAIEPLYFANYLLIPLMLLLVLLVRGQSEKIINKFLAYVISAGILLNIILAISRGAYIALAAAMFALAVTQAKLIFRAKTVLATIMVSLLILTGTYLGLVKSEPRAIDEFVSHLKVEDRTEGESVVSRVSATESAYQMFQAHPYFGVGLGNYGPVVQDDPAEIPEGGWFIVNNEYMEILAENGIVGLLVFLIILLTVFVRAIKAISKERDEFIKSVLIGLSLALFGILVQYLTFSTLYIFHIWFLIGFLSAVTYLSFKKGHDEKPA
jgi:O-antigen ligase